MRRTVQLLGALVALSLLIAACGGGGASTTTSAPKATTAPTTVATAAATTVPATAVPTATAVTRPTATVALTSSGELLAALPTLGNYFLNPAAEGKENPWTDVIYDPLVGTTVDGKLDGKVGFIQSWSADADSKVWTFKVRNDVVFHNGDKATSSDAAYDLELSLDPKTNTIISRAADIVRSVAKLETPDAATLVVTLNSTDIFWYATYLGRTPPNGTPKTLLNKGYLTSVGLQTGNTKPVGSGPYKLRQVVVGDRIITEAVSNHWLYAVPRIQTYSFLGVPDENTRVALMETKGADLSSVSTTNAARARKSGLGIASRQGSLVGTFWTNQYPDQFPDGTANPFANVTVRQALFWHALDRKAYVSSFLGGEGKATIDYPVASWDISNLPNLPVPAFDMAKAKDLLAQAGYAKGFQIDMYVTPDGVIPTGQIMEAIATSWETLGLKVNRLPVANFTKDRTDALAKTKGFVRPTVQWGQYGNRLLAGPGVAVHYDPANASSVSYSPEGLRLALHINTAKTLPDYTTKVEAFRQFNYKNVSAWMALFEANELWAKSDRVSKTWQLGQDQYYRLADAAALR